MLEKIRSQAYELLLILPPCWATNMPCLGLEYVRAESAAHGYSVGVFDMNIDMYWRVAPEKRCLWSFEEHSWWVEHALFEQQRSFFAPLWELYAEYLLSLNTPSIGFSIQAGSRLFVAELIREMRKRESGGVLIPHIIVGGPLCNLNRSGDLIVDEYRSLVDTIVVGEGEHVVAEILKRMRTNKPLNGIPGVILTDTDEANSWKKGYVPAVAVEDLDALAFPDFRHYDLTLYTEKVLPVLTTRGCPGQYLFWDALFFQRGYRSRSQQSVVEELLFHKETVGYEVFTFNDLALNWDVKRLEALCDEIIDRQLPIMWNASAVIHKNMTYELFCKMKKAGCHNDKKTQIYGIEGGSILFGLESGSDAVLARMNKGYTRALAERVLADSHRAGLTTVVNILVGFPGETEDEFQATLDFISKNAKSIDRLGTVSICYEPEFSDLSALAHEYGICCGEHHCQYEWCTEEGKTPVVRNDRMEYLISLGNKLRLMPLATTMKYGETADILLVMPAPWGIDVPPLSIACLSSFMCHKGIRTAVFDFNVSLFNRVDPSAHDLWSMNYGDWWHDSEKFSKIQEKIQPALDNLIAELVSRRERIIGISLPTNCSDIIVTHIVRAIKAHDPSKVIILGGVSISIDEQRSSLLHDIAELVDLCILGEGELALTQTVKGLKSGLSPADIVIDGVLTARDFFAISQQKAILPGWKDVPFPTFEEFNLNAYKTKGGSLSIEFTRGCIGNCPFCDFKTVNDRVKTKPPSLIVEQVAYYKRRYNTNHLSIVDSSINSHPQQFEAICDALIAHKNTLRFSGLAIARKEMIRPVLEKMKKAGFYRIEYGLESGSNSVLKKMHKIFTKEIAEQVIRDTHAAGIDVYLYLIVGFPGETQEDFEQTKQFLARNQPYITMIKSINPLYIMAGSYMYKHPGEYGIILPDVNADREWTASENTYALRRDRVYALKHFVIKSNIPFTEEAESYEFKLEHDKREAIDFTCIVEKWKQCAFENPPDVRASSSSCSWCYLFFLCMRYVTGSFSR